MSLVDKFYEFDYPLDINSVFERIVSISNYVQGLKFGRADVDNHIVILKSGISWNSYGEIVTISCTPLDAYSTHVMIKSAPAVPFTLYDWGKGKKNINNVLNAMQQVLPPTQ